jgi:hypothetical protein
MAGTQKRREESSRRIVIHALSMKERVLERGLRSRPMSS